MQTWWEPVSGKRERKRIYNKWQYGRGKGCKYGGEERKGMDEKTDVNTLLGKSE